MKNVLLAVPVFLFGLGCVSLAAENVPDAVVSNSPSALNLPDGAECVLRDDFSRKEIGKDWSVLSGSWEIRTEVDGNSHLYSVGTPGEIVFTKPLGENFRVEYMAWSTNAGDRTLTVYIPKPNFEYRPVYYYQFGGDFSTLNSILAYGSYIAGPIKTSLPISGRKHKVIVQKTGSYLQMFIDGAPVLAGYDAKYETIKSEVVSLGMCLGFYTWSTGSVCYDDLVAYRLPVGLTTAPGEVKTEYSMWQGFEDDSAGQKPRKGEVQAGEGCLVLVKNEPTVMYYPKPKGQVLENDLCLALTDAGRKKENGASYTLATRPMQSGEAELELLAEYYEGEDCARISLIGQNGDERAALIIDGQGAFFADTPNGKKKLLDKISYPSRPPNAGLYFQAKRWFNLRFGFSAENGTWQVSLVNLYNNPSPCWGVLKYICLGADLPMTGAGEVCGIKVMTWGKTGLWLDNIMAASPGGKTINGKSSEFSLRDILSLDYRLRKDPLCVSVCSFKNIPDPQNRNTPELGYVKPVTPAFVPAGIRYDKLLIRQGMLEEKANLLARIYYHLIKAGKGEAVGQNTADVISRIKASRNGLDELYRLYGLAFFDSLNEKIITGQFGPAADAYDLKLSELEKTAETSYQSLINCAGEKLEPVPLGPGPEEGALQFSNQRYERNGKPVFIHHRFLFCFTDMKGIFNLGDLSKDGTLAKMLMLDNAEFVSGTVDSERGKDGAEITWKGFDGYMKRDWSDVNPGADLLNYHTFGQHSCMGHCPQWWLDSRKENSDIFFCDRNGKVPKAPYAARNGGYHAAFNFWNPEVKAMYKDYWTSWSRHIKEKYPDRMKFVNVGAEQLNHGEVEGGISTETGYNESAITAFREWIKTRYGTIENLNKTWNTAYASFSEIDQRKYSNAKPNGLMYDFQMFRQDGYWEWMKIVKNALKENLPEVPFANDFHHGFGHLRYEYSFDLPAMFRVYDIVGFHDYGPPVGKCVMLRCLDSLRKVYGNCLGGQEWGQGQACSSLFEEDGFRAAALRDLFQHLAWGKSQVADWDRVHASYMGPGFFAACVGNSIFRYSTVFAPITRMRTRRFGEIALTCPTIAPNLVIMEPTASHFNNMGCREMMTDISLSFEKDRWNYGFVWEDLLISGEQKLAGVQTLIVPRGLCLKPETTPVLLDWVKKGGTLIAVMPPGVLNQYGQPDGRLLREIFGQVKFELSADFKKAAVNDLQAEAKVKVVDPDKDKIVIAPFGKGTCYVFTSAEPYPEESLLRVVNEKTPRVVTANNGRLTLAAREDKKFRYVFAVNPTDFDTVEDTVILTGRFDKAVDLGSDYAFPVKTDYSNGATRFDLRLAPGEGTVIRLNKRRLLINIP